MIVIASTRKLTLAHLARSPISYSRVWWLLLRPVIPGKMLGYSLEQAHRQYFTAPENLFNQILMAGADGKMA